jgi:tRNA(Ile)-lysidine synthase
MKKVIVAVSGGPDSMYLLYKLNKSKFIDPVVAHVNYNFRPESKLETEMVVKFCKDNNIKVHTLNVDKEILNKYSHLSNKQQLAREIRYDFFKELAEKYETKEVYIAHHKDDFIETAIMKEGRSKELPFYGIEKLSEYKGLTIKRPLLNLYKDDILDKLNKKNIPYMVDKSNLDTKYERNRIRINLSKKSKKEKNKIFKYYKGINKSNESYKSLIDQVWKEFRNSEYDRRFFNSLTDDLKVQMMFKYLTYSSQYIKINKNKVEGAIEFVETKKGKEYRLMENVFLTIKDSKIKIYNK